MIKEAFNLKPAKSILLKKQKLSNHKPTKKYPIKTVFNLDVTSKN